MSQSFPLQRALTLLALLCANAHAATYVVTKTADTLDGACDADCSLREAVVAANATPDADVIRLAASTYRLERAPVDEQDGARRGDLEVDAALTIRGPSGGATIDANQVDRAFEVLPGAALQLVDITVRNGRRAGRGGGIYNAGDLVLRRSGIVSCRLVEDADGAIEGGGLYNAGTARLVAARVDGNVGLGTQVLVGGRGAGIFNAAGAALYSYDSNVRGNANGLDDADGFGAGLYNLGRARIDRSYFGHNDPGDGEGSAIANRAGATLALFNSTLSGNGHDGALGALINGSAATGEDPAGGNVYVFNATIAFNNGGGLYNRGKLRLRNAIVAGNYTQDGNDRYFHGAGHNCHSDVPITQDHSIVGDDGNCPAALTVDNATVFQTVLGHLAYDGHATAAHPLLPGSPAIDAGNPEACPGWDQWNGARPLDGDGDGVATCDVGAVEQPPP